MVVTKVGNVGWPPMIVGLRVHEQTLPTVVAGILRPDVGCTTRPCRGTCPLWRCAGSPTCTPATSATGTCSRRPPPAKPHVLRRVHVDEALADLEVTVGFDHHLAAEVSCITIADPRTAHAHAPGAGTRARDPGYTTTSVLELLSRFGGPTGGEGRLAPGR